MKKLTTKYVHQLLRFAVFPESWERKKQTNKTWKANNPENGLAAKKRYSLKNPGQSDRHNAERGERWRIFMAHQKNKPCMDCGQSYPPHVMDFDHRPDQEKSFGVSRGKIKPIEAVLAEIAKRDLVCANCHRIRTYLRSNKNRQFDNTAEA